MDGCANVVVSSDTSAASASQDDDTADELTPFHVSPVAVTFRAMRRMSDSDRSSVLITDGSSWNGTK
jgi:hypothetical protein